MSGFYPFINVAVNVEWSDGNYNINNNKKFKEHGRPNSIYTKQIFENGLKGVILSGLTLSSNGNACWSGHDQIPMNWALPLSKVLKDSGKRVGVSFGGINESTQDVSSKFSIEQLEKIYIDVIEMYEIDHLDICLMGSLNNVDFILKALKKVIEKYPHITISLTLPASTHGLNPTGMTIISKVKENQLINNNNNNNLIINLITMGFYNDDWKNNMDKDIISVIKNLKDQLNSLYPSLNDDQLYQRIAITPMIGKNPDTSILSFENVKVISNFAKEKNLGFLSMWNLNRDNPRDNQDAIESDEISSLNPNQKQSCQYIKAFNGSEN
ncbi:hypothetical protein ACTFIR_007681 [Dictyostelium discoideum]